MPRLELYFTKIQSHTKWGRNHYLLELNFLGTVWLKKDRKKFTRVQISIHFLPKELMGWGNPNSWTYTFRSSNQERSKTSPGKQGKEEVCRCLFVAVVVQEKQLTPVGKVVFSLSLSWFTDPRVNKVANYFTWRRRTANKKRTWWGTWPEDPFYHFPSFSMATTPSYARQPTCLFWRPFSLLIVKDVNLDRFNLPTAVDK